MKSPASFYFAAALAIFLPAISANVRAQAPAGPIHPRRTDADTSAPPPVEKKPLPRRDLWGDWTLNLGKSDDPRKKMNDPRANTGVGPVWGGYPGGRGGYPGGVSGRNTNADRNRLDDLIDPANSLSLVRNEAEIDITDNAERKRALFTDGRKLQKSKDDKYKQLAAHWDGQRLLADEKGPNGMKLTRSFEISANGQQLYETLAIDRGGPSGFVLIRYIYDPKPAAASATESEKR